MKFLEWLPPSFLKKVLCACSDADSRRNKSIARFSFPATVIDFLEEEVGYSLCINNSKEGHQSSPKNDRLGRLTFLGTYLENDWGEHLPREGRHGSFQKPCLYLIFMLLSKNK